MKALTDMLASERAVFVIAIAVIPTSILAGMGLVSAQEWMSFARDVTFAFLGSKTVTTSLEVWKDAKTEAAATPTPARTEATVSVTATTEAK